MNKIMDFFGKYKYQITCIVLIIIIILLLLSAVDIIRKKSYEVDRLNHNISALNDSIEYFKTKNGEIFAEKLSYIVKTDKELKELNEELYNSKIELEKALKKLGEKEEIIAGASIITTITDTLKINDTVYLTKYEDKKFSIPYKDEIIDMKLDMEYTQEKLYIDKMMYNLDIPVEAYFTKEGRILLKSKNKNVKFSDVQSFIDSDIYSKPKKFSFGVQLGVGGMCGYDFKSKSISTPVGLYLGVGISYKLFEF